MPFRINFGAVSIYNYLPDYNEIRPSIINVQLFIILLFSGTFPAFNLSFSTCFFFFWFIPNYNYNYKQLQYKVKLPEESFYIVIR